MAQTYDVSLLADGWIQIRVTAENRAMVERQMQTGQLYFAILNADHTPVGEVVSSMFDVQDEDVEVYRPECDDDYHAPAPQKRIPISRRE